MATAIATPIANPRVEVVRRVTLAVANRAYGTSRRPRGACIDTEVAATNFGEPARAPGGVPPFPVPRLCRPRHFRSERGHAASFRGRTRNYLNLLRRLALPAALHRKLASDQGIRLRGVRSWPSLIRSLIGPLSPDARQTGLLCVFPPIVCLLLGRAANRRVSHNIS